MSGRPTSPHRVQSAHGFTLLELLVVMSLLSIIMLGLGSALRGIAQTEDKIDQRLDRLSEIRVIRNFIQSTMSRVSAPVFDAPNVPGQRAIPFKATNDTLIWVGNMPARPDIGGKHFFKLGMEESPSGLQLTLRYAPWNPDNNMPDWTQSEVRVLLKGTQAFSVQAQGDPPNRNNDKPWPQGWQEGWPVHDALPERIRLNVVDQNGPWPPWILPLHAAVQSDSSFSMVVIGGGR